MSGIIMNFSGVYKEQEFYRNRQIKERVEAEQVKETTVTVPKKQKKKLKN